jgi:hypothetical protein
MSRSGRPTCFFAIEYSKISHDKEAGEVYGKYCLARRVRTYQRRDAGVKAGGGQPGSNTREGRSLDVYHRSKSRIYLYKGKELDTNIEDVPSNSITLTRYSKILVMWFNIVCRT